MSPGTLSLFGNAISFLAFLGTTLYDLWINPALFRRDLKSGMDHIPAARCKRNRQEIATKVAFAALSLAFAAFLWGDMMNTSGQPGESIQVEFQALIQQTEVRLTDELLELRKRVERLEGGSGGQDVATSPSGPSGPNALLTSARLEEVEARIEALARDLDNGNAELERKFRELTEIVAEMNGALREMSAQPAHVKVSTVAAEVAR